ncbi:MAG TPA: pitrilysin family protein [Gemmatimonadales bacterium]|nr:pitrilysin family protein [Gemmatimonadales bacterium]
MRRPPSVLLFALLFVAPAAAQNVRDTTLANGLQVLVAENHRLPEATVTVVVRTGAFTQEPNQDGLSHLYEHLLYRSYPHGNEGFAHDAGKFEGGFNGYTSVDWVQYMVELPSNHVPDALGLLSHLVRNATFSASDISSERPVVLDELARDYAAPQSQLEREVQERLWGAAWSRVDVRGDSTTLDVITQPVVQSQYARFYVPNNAAVIVSGDVSTAEVWQAAAGAFGDWTKSSTLPDVHPPSAPLMKTTFVLVPAPVPDITYLVAVQGPANGPADTDAVPADMLTRVLNSSTSAFQGRLVDQGAFTSVASTYFGYRYHGWFEFKGRTTMEHARPALLALLNELDVMDVMQGASDDDLLFARRAEEVSAAIAAQNTNGLALTLADSWGGPGVAAYFARTERLAAVKMSDVVRVAGTYVAGRPRVVGILAPPAAIDVIKTWLSAASGGQP